MSNSLKRKNASGVKEGDLREKFESFVAAVGGTASDENFIKWLVARDGEEGSGGGGGNQGGESKKKLSKTGGLHFQADFTRIMVERICDGRLDPLLNVTDQAFAATAFREEVLACSDDYDVRDVSRRLRNMICDFRIFWRYGVYTCVSGRGTEKGKWVWQASRTAHPYYRKHTDAIQALVIETDARTKYPTHEEKKAALLSIDGLVLHELPAKALDALDGEAKDEMVAACLQLELESKTQIEELEKKAGSSKVRKVAEAVAEDNKAKGKAASVDPKGKAVAEDPKGKKKAVAEDAEEGFEVGSHVVLYCVVESLVNDPEILPTGFYHEKGKSAIWTADMPLLTGMITHPPNSKDVAAHGLKSGTAKKKSVTALHLNGEYVGIKVLSLAVDKDDVGFDNAPLLLSAWQNGMEMAFVGLEKLYGKGLKANDKIAGPGGLGSQLLTAMEEKTYPFGDKSKWGLVVPISHLRPIFKENLHRAYETTSSEAGSPKEILSSASSEDGSDD
ncbi:hypothetical protein CYMTET_5965 [Cymbomonas tetramitiformis]|uniref:Uncharacterized protein n=1 Tax=Cymbomonas tetramitiformis TaxID=36881 RepID=A0AAE0GYG3_9CHLO|nr:hypothetical protein CYMTET_5965 [Cymbomonas tetramitiformis]